jgi:hypothetical protein
MAYIGNWPTTVGFNTTNFKTITDTRQTVSQSGRRIRVSTASSRFSATLKYPPMTLANWKPIQAVAVRSQGPLNSFDIQLPSVSDNSSGTTGITATVNGATSQGSASVVLATNKNSTTILKAGDVVRFASHNKVYMVTADATTDGAGAVTIGISPNLFEDVTDTSSVTVDDVPFRMTLERDVQEFKYATNGTVAYEIDVIEEL